MLPCWTGDISEFHTKRLRDQNAERIAARWGLIGYLRGVGLVILATILGLLVSPYFAPANILIWYLLAVVVAAFYLGRLQSIFVSALSVLAFNMFFVPPHFTFFVADPQYLITFLGLFVVGGAISELVNRARRQTLASLARERETAQLYAMSYDLSGAVGLEAIIQAILKNGTQIFGTPIAVLLPDGERPGQLKVYSQQLSRLELVSNEFAVADWVLRHGKVAGQGTETLKSAAYHHAPLKSGGKVFGVMVSRLVEGAYEPTADRERLIRTFTGQAALAIERAQLAEAARQAEVLARTERIQSALLNSVSHDLRTPLVAITGALSALQDLTLDKTTKQRLFETSREQAERLNRLVGNLLDLSRIEADALKLKSEPCHVDDILGAALEEAHHALNQREIRVDVPASLPYLYVDAGLITNAISKLLDNAVKYSPPEEPIEIAARQVGNMLEISIADRGKGIPPEDLPHLFERFYQTKMKSNRQASDGGVGLGLSISRGIVEAHGGKIWASNRSDGGSVFTVALPTSSGGEEE